jgi:signal-transduction protein with cAMP-binding, CBS, and nucleotidyltransferase domain
MFKIADLMVTPLICIDAQSTIEQAAILLGEKRISSLVVKDNDDHVGILTKSDIITKSVAKGLDPKTTKIASIMSKPLFKMDHYYPPKQANEFMQKKKIKHLVITDSGKAVGILTLRDMVS